MKLKLGIIVFITAIFYIIPMWAQQEPFPIKSIDSYVLDSSPTEKHLALKIMELLNYKKNPFAASSLSLIYAGAGQFYNGDYTRGSLFFLGETVYHIFNFGIRFRFQTAYNGSANFIDMQLTDQVLIASSFVIFLGIKIFSMYDAYYAAEKFNQQIDRKIQNLIINADPENFSVSYNLRL